MKEENKEFDIDSENGYLASLPGSSQVCTQLIKDQVVREISFYSRYLLSI